ncbi:MAG: efflux RND transporter periplasmic adaptor subunit [Alphaproteobacteria bacterium]|nr:efflux RND transporter periplasmic adaptor subunit [Alphaproteobacteria bacterium]
MKKVEVKEKKPSFIRRFFAWVWRHKWWSLIVVIILLTVGIWWFFATKTEKVEYVTVNITRGDLRHVVTATGEINPVNTVSVGSQVSGTIENIYVDYNSHVNKGDLLLTIEPSVLQASVDEARATLDSAKSQLTLAKNDYERNKTLYDSGYIARAEMEQSQTNYEQAVQSVKRAQSQYDRAETNLSYATITSPVEGTVISRKVDKGQTVAASFQTPDLFEIAEDLSKMQIETAVSEADIGVIKEGQNVTFTVDAYPTKKFNGVVRQVRLSPTTTSNVVVYTVVIDVDNSDLELMPGMTAFVTILISEARDIWKSQNAAFLVRNFKNIIPDAPDNIEPSDHMAIMRGKDVVYITYEKGLVTATETQIVSDELKVGDKVIVGRVGQSTSSAATQSRRRGGPGGPM